MKKIRLQLKEALGGKSGAWYREFTLPFIAGLAILFGIIFGMEADSVRAPFDLKVAIACFVLAGACVLFASDRVFVLSCAVMVPASLLWFNAVLTEESESSDILFCGYGGWVRNSHFGDTGSLILAGSAIPSEQVTGLNSDDR